LDDEVYNILEVKGDFVLEEEKKLFDSDSESEEDNTDKTD